MPTDKATDQNAIISDLCLNKPLYTSVDDPDNDGERRLRECLKWDTVQFDCYCIHCRMITPFRAYIAPPANRSISSVSSSRSSPRLFGNGFINLTPHCQRNSLHFYVYIFSTAGNKIMKIGQYPTYEDIAAVDLVPYRSVLDRLDFSELRKAGGLFSHDISVGAFVYLRRIFERLIQRHYEDCLQQTEALETWSARRMDEKIDALTGVLPATLVENKQIYGILSKGVHALEEEECKRYFPAIRAGIMSILEEDLQRRAKEKAAADLRKAIGDIAAEIKDNQ